MQSMKGKLCLTLQTYTSANIVNVFMGNVQNPTLYAHQIKCEIWFTSNKQCEIT